MNHKNATREHLVFVGKNHITGRPNKITGMFSVHGELLKFSTREEAKKFIEHRRTLTESRIEIIQIGTRNTLRKFFLGSSKESFHFDCDHLQIYK